MDDIMDEHEVDKKELNQCLDYSAISSEENNDVTASTVDLDEKYKAVKPQQVSVHSKIHKMIETGCSIAGTSTCTTRTLRSLAQRTDEALKEGLSKNQKMKKRKNMKNEQTEDETSGKGSGKLNVGSQMNRNMLRLDEKEKRKNRYVTEANRENSGMRNCQIPNDVKHKTEHVVIRVKTKIEQQTVRTYEPLNRISLQTLQPLRPGVSKRPNYRNIDEIPLHLRSDFVKLFDSLTTLLTNLPLDTASIASTIDDYLLFLPFLQVRPLRLFYQLAATVKSVSKAHADFAQDPGERSARRYLNILHKHRKLQLQTKRPKAFSKLEVSVLGDLLATRRNLSATISSEMGAYVKRKRSVFDEAVWRCLGLKSWKCGSIVEKTFCIISWKLRSDDELTDIDEFRERRYFYDGSYCEENCDSWLHFRNLYLNSVVSGAVGSHSSAVIAGLVKDASRSSGDTSRNFPQALSHSEGNDSNIYDNASVSDETFNTFEDCSTINSVDKMDLESSDAEDLVQNDEKSDSLFCGNEETKMEDIKNITADNLKFFQELSSTKSIMLSSLVLLVFSKVILFILFYNFETVFLLVVFMYLCIYFVIKS